MRLEVRHVTGYQYHGRVTASYNEARMTPTSAAGQLVLSSRLEIAPAPWTYPYRDYWGCQVTAFELHEPHEELLVRAVSDVQVSRRAPRSAGLTWQEIERVRDSHAEWLSVSPRVAPGPELVTLVEQLRAEADGPSELAEAVVDLVADEVAYVMGSTEVHGTAQDAWAERNGVCQDLAHLCVGALRSQGVPARYVSGYLHPAREPVVGETVTGESHAWIEWWDGAWMPFDPTNRTVPDDRYVVVGAARDYADVAPLMGIFSGGQTSSMFVQVELTRLA